MKSLRSLLALLAALAVLAPAAYAVDPPPDKKTAAKEAGKIDVQNPIRNISDLMKKASKLLEQLETGQPTQEEQKKILKELDTLIQMAEEASSSSKQKQQQQQNDSSSKPQKPENSSSSSQGDSPMASERDVIRAIRHQLGTTPPDLREMWGKLPDAQREEIMQLLSEKLPMKYKQLLYLYFKALSEKK